MSRPPAMSLLSRVFLCWVALTTAGCGAPFEMSVPDTFVRLDDDAQERDGYEMRSVTNDGVVLAMQVIEHKVEGSLAFWTEAVTRRIRDAQGYALLGTQEVHAATGQPGNLVRFGRDIRGAAYRYTVAIYVTADHIFIAEAGGREDAYVPLEGSIEAALVAVELE